MIFKLIRAIETAPGEGRRDERRRADANQVKRPPIQLSGAE